MKGQILVSRQTWVIRLAAVYAFLVFGTAFATSPALPAPKVELTVSAAISLKDSLDEITQLYHAEAPDVVIRFNYGASGTLQRQVEQGAPVDIFVSASPNQMDALESAGLVLSGTRKDIVRNQIVLIVPKGEGRNFEFCGPCGTGSQDHRHWRASRRSPPGNMRRRS